MNHDKAAPKFMKPGDDPELDRMLEEARGKGAEPQGEYYYDMFGRRRLVPAVGAEKEKRDKGAATGVVTPKRQARWLALGALAIVGPVVALALGAFQPGKVPQEAGSAAAGSAAAMMSAAPAVDGGAAAPAVPMTAVPVIEEDAGAAPAVTGAPRGSGAPVGPAPVKLKSSKGRGGDPYDAPAPGSAKTVEPVVPAPLPLTPTSVQAIPPPATATPTTHPKVAPPASSGRILGSDEG